MIAILFDLDGTLILSVEEHCYTFIEAAKEYGYHVGEKEIAKFKSEVGKRVEEILKAVYPEMSEDEIKKIARRKTELMLENIDRVKVNEDIASMLPQLSKRYVLGIVSS
jgi:beta-phosphoglucomutase-like phosphatase (HAD superfamily)